MDVLKQLKVRSQNSCELCKNTSDLSVHLVPSESQSTDDNSLLVCDLCLEQIKDFDKIKLDHWSCLSESMWSEFPAVQVMSWKILNHIKSEGWAQNLLGQIYLNDKAQEMVNEMASSSESTSENVITRDSNGAQLNEGDSVTLIKDLDVKGANFTAKRGTLVKNISLTHNPEHIEGRVNGVHIVLVANFLKKA